MKVKFMFFIIWFLIIGLINVVPFIAVSQRGISHGALEIFGVITFLFLSAPFIIFGVIQWIRKKLDIYQKTMIVLLAVATIVFYVAATVGGM